MLSKQKRVLIPALALASIFQLGWTDGVPQHVEIDVELDVAGTPVLVQAEVGTAPEEPQGEASAGCTKRAERGMERGRCP